MRRPVEKLILQLTIMLVAAAARTSTDCDQWCGEIQIPYPFGMKKECCLNEHFFITCNKIDYHPPKAFLQRGNVEVTKIFISGELHILNCVAKECYTKDGPSKSITTSLKISPFSVSHSQNKFTVIGCDTYAHIYGELGGESYKGGCMTLCGNSTNAIRNGTCTGNGYCQLEIPEGLKDLNLEVQSFKNHTDVLSFNPCGYAFVIQQDNFAFSSKYITNFTQEKVPLVLDWAIPNDTCSTPNNKTNCSICGQNAKKENFLKDGSEYRCHCLKGFNGNPYLPGGCEDINECENESHNCTSKNMCFNGPGNYTCHCPKNYNGDGKSDGEGCHPNISYFIRIIIGTGVGFPVLVTGSIFLCLSYRKRRFIQRKEKFFKNNGGLMLQQHLAQWKSADMLKIFTQEELKNATNKYHESAVVGKGGYGTVYKGVLDDGLTVAIKKSKLVNQSQTDQFINEIIVLSQINHRNVVKIVGCCLETKVPLLVYEFVANGTLSEHVHNKIKHASLSWEVRLKIASEIAGVLSYLHFSASTPIIHRDIKSSNILLDHNYTAKLSDFGISKLVLSDQTQISTLVQGTLGYLDPEYLLTGELTEKSDVYSFGIMLMELLTGKTAVHFDGPEEERNLAMYFLCAMKEDRVEEVVEKGMATEENIEQIKEVAKLAKDCVKVKGEERPTMKEVAMELEGVRHVHMQVECSQTEKNLFDRPSSSGQLGMNYMDESMKQAENLSHVQEGR